ncbi:unnamed protein product [Cylicostephanus goldi]|uniref:Uncharacterized protein n=1 Tax=Cylicostephanus goldi TaxID=71465 RepID=A0A3P6U2G9_CYLGO|nr:unnamed protein product [Cylicostephanus goldi]
MQMTAPSEEIQKVSEEIRKEEERQVAGAEERAAVQETEVPAQPPVPPPRKLLEEKKEATEQLTSESTLKMKTTTPEMEESQEEVGTDLHIEGASDKVATVEKQMESATFAKVTHAKTENIVVTAISPIEQFSEESTTIDARRPNAHFSHAVTVVEPEVSLPNSRIRKFRDICTWSK